MNVRPRNVADFFIILLNAFSQPSRYGNCTGEEVKKKIKVTAMNFPDFLMTTHFYSH